MCRPDSFDSDVYWRKELQNECFKIIFKIVDKVTSQLHIEKLKSKPNVHIDNFVELRLVVNFLFRQWVGNKNIIWNFDHVSFVNYHNFWLSYLL